MTKVNSLYLGNSNVEKMYLGTDIVYERGGTIEDVDALPVASEYKYKVVRLTTDNNLYQSVQISIDVWDWKALTNDWAVGSTYRFYYDNSITPYGLQDWLKGILANCTTNEFLAVRDKIVEVGGKDDGTKILFTVTTWNGDEWVIDVIDVGISEWISFIDATEFSDIVEQLLQAKDENYNPHYYTYINNIMIVTDDWQFSNLNISYNEYALYVQFPIDYPEYIETYPQKND